MKKFVLLAITLCATYSVINISHATPRHAAPPELSAPAVAAYDKLHAATFFALGGVGIGGEISSNEIAFRELQSEPNAVASFFALLDDETTTKVGQLYALLGLKEAKSPEFEMRLPAFLADDSTVTQMSGCIRVPVKVKEIAARFVDKKRVRIGARLKSALSGVFTTKK